MGFLMINPVIKYFLVYTLIVISFLLFFAVTGYYTFVFEWHHDFIWSAINALILLTLVGASIVIYYIAEKIKICF